MAEMSEKIQHELASIRDTVESIWVAIVLAFVLRAFVVEAFVIPTGSMAPRLYGEHLDLQCPECGYEYAFGWSGEQRRAESGYGRYGSGGEAMANGQQTPIGARCPSCGWGHAEPRFVAGGDRVLVMKYLYRFREPQPWDVVVFKNPQDNRQNYIKRLIGLPGETIEIVHGDIFVRKPGRKDFLIRRKTDPKVQKAMWQVVFENDYRPRRLPREDPDNPQRPAYPVWDPADSLAQAQWKLGEPKRDRTFSFTGAAPGREAELVLRADDDMFLPRYGYNTALQADRDLDVVSDLKFAVTYFPQAPDSRLALTLTSFEHAFRGEIGADGAARLLYRRTDDPPTTGWTPLAADRQLAAPAIGRGLEVALVHVDLQVELWVDGRRVLVSRDRDADTPAADRGKYPVGYRLLKQRIEEARAERNRRAIPLPQVRIAAAGGACAVQHVQLMRDVYYTSPRLTEPPPRGPNGDFARDIGTQKSDLGWGVTGHPITLEACPEQPDLDQFFVLGDNSPSSLDGRLWTSAAITLRLYDKTGKVGDPHLAEGDIDWGPFLKQWLRQAADAADSPGKRLWLGLSADLRGELGRLRPDDLRYGYIGDPLKAAVIQELNEAISDRGFFHAAAWEAAGTKLPDRARPLMAKAGGLKALTARQLADLNRLAMEAAFPEQITTRRRTYQLGTVPRYSMIGKAVFVYWPAGFRPPMFPALPIIPNVGRMRLIR